MSKVGLGLSIFQILVVVVACILNPHATLGQMLRLGAMFIASIGPWIIFSSKGENKIGGLILEGLYIGSFVDLYFMIRYNIV